MRERHSFIGSQTADKWSDRIDNVSGVALEYAGSAAFLPVRIGHALVNGTIDEINRLGRSGEKYMLYPSAQPRTKGEE